MIARILNLNAIQKKKVIAEALKLFREGLERKNMETFSNYISNYGDLFSLA